MPQPTIEYTSYGFWMAHADWKTNELPSFHQHNEMELDLIYSGSATYERGGALLTPVLKQVYFFWSAVPHRFVKVVAPYRAYSLSVPAPWVLQYELPKEILARLFHGECFCESHSAPDEQAADLVAFRRWHELLKLGDTESRKIVMLEAEARIRRLFRNAAQLPAEKCGPFPNAKVAQMIQYLTEHYTEPLLVTQVAEAVGLSPKYAITQFRKTCGVNLVDHLNQLRVYHAQRLLVTTQEKMVDVAYTSGFGSLSQFHAVFKRAVGTSPTQFKKTLRSSH
ncbi:MAG: Melibiose operon regulatory protein [Verrucomicrobiae bacterium]|nr:Melibiose operon regulatory protein [Verrucomicrobiae bacterium]